MLSAYSGEVRGEVGTMIRPTVINVTSNTIHYVPTLTAPVENDFWKRPLNGRKKDCGTKCIESLH